MNSYIKKGTRVFRKSTSERRSRWRASMPMPYAPMMYEISFEMVPAHFPKCVAKHRVAVFIERKPTRERRGSRARDGIDSRVSFSGTTGTFQVRFGLLTVCRTGRVALQNTLRRSRPRPVSNHSQFKETKLQIEWTRASWPRAASMPSTTSISPAPRPRAHRLSRFDIRTRTTDARSEGPRAERVRAPNRASLVSPGHARPTPQRNYQRTLGSLPMWFVDVSRPSTPCLRAKMYHFREIKPPRLDRREMSTSDAAVCDWLMTASRP